jgi:hypothetical protein
VCVCARRWLGVALHRFVELGVESFTSIQRRAAQADNSTSSSFQLRGVDRAPVSSSLPLQSRGTLKASYSPTT